MERVNLNALDTIAGADRGFDLEVNAPDGRKLPGHIRIRGYDSAVYRALLDEQQRKRLGRMAIGKQTTPTIEEMEDETMALVAALIMGWTVPFDLEGKPFEFSAQNARTLVERFPWLRTQIDRAASVRANFLQGSSGN